MENEFIDKNQLDELKRRAAADQKEKEEKEQKKEAKKNARRDKIVSTSRKPNAFVQILNGDFLTKEFMLNNLTFIFFIMFLLILLVGKGYYGKTLNKKVIDTQLELDELTSDYFEAKARLEEETQRTKLVDKLEKKGLKETENPTKVIRIRKDINE